MKDKRIGITIKHRPEKDGYQVTQIKNAAVIDFSSDLKLVIGYILTQVQADEVARCKAYDVTVTS